MRCFWDERQRAHLPTAEFFNGKLHPAAEHQGRVEAILAAIGPTEASADHGIEPILRVHGGDYVEFLRSAFAAWRAAGREGDAFPYTFPVVGRRPLGLNRIDALLGQFSFDTATPIGERTWDAAYWSVQTALAALDAVLGGEPTAFAFTRPPGHHAGADYLGGYSYLNHAAICAEAALAAGRNRSRSSTSIITTATAHRTFLPAGPMSPSPRSMPTRRPTIPSTGAMPTRAAAISSTSPCRAAPSGVGTSPR